MVNFIFTLIGAIFFGFVILHEVAHIAFLGMILAIALILKAGQII